VVSHLRTQYRVLPQWPRCAAKAELFSTTRDRKGLLEVFKRLPQADYLLGKPILSRDDSNSNIGSVLSPGNIGSVLLSPHDVSLMKAVKLWKKEGSSLLLLRYPVLRIAPRTISLHHLQFPACFS